MPYFKSYGKGRKLFKKWRKRKLFKKGFSSSYKSARILNSLTTNEMDYINAVTNPFGAGNMKGLRPCKVLDHDNSTTFAAVLTCSTEITYLDATVNHFTVQVHPPASGDGQGIVAFYYTSASATASTTGTQQDWNSYAAYNAIAGTNKVRIAAMGLEIYPTSSAQNTNGSILYGNVKYSIGTADAVARASTDVDSVLKNDSPINIEHGICLRTPPEDTNITFHTPNTDWDVEATEDTYYLPTAHVRFGSGTSVIVRAVCYVEVVVSQTAVPVPIGVSPSSMHWNEILAIVSSNEFPIVTAARTYKSFKKWVQSVCRKGSYWMKHSNSPAVRALLSIAG